MRSQSKSPVAGLDPAIHVLITPGKTWVRGSSPRKGIVVAPAG
jgi:hypothetical protein